eukprot:Colp12_sorted_trinity150504_noHs@14149
MLKIPTACGQMLNPPRRTIVRPWTGSVHMKRTTMTSRALRRIRGPSKLFRVFKDLKPAYHVDLHTFSVLSIPFIFLDRVLYGDEPKSDDVMGLSPPPTNEVEANELFKRTSAMVDALGLTVVCEAPAKHYVKKKLHRSTSGATLNLLRVPSCTIELGPMHSASPSNLQAGINALNNLLVHAGLTDGSLIDAMSVPVIKTQERHRYVVYPRTPVCGVVDFVKEAGEKFVKGELLAVVRSVHGERLHEITADFEGYVVGWWSGVAYYPQQSIGMMAARDENSPVASWASVEETKQ